MDVSMGFCSPIPPWFHPILKPPRNSQGWAPTCEKDAITPKGWNLTPVKPMYFRPFYTDPFSNSWGAQLGVQSSTVRWLKKRTSLKAWHAQNPITKNLYTTWNEWETPNARGSRPFFSPQKGSWIVFEASIFRCNVRFSWRSSGFSSTDFGSRFFFTGIYHYI